MILSGSKRAENTGDCIILFFTTPAVELRTLVNLKENTMKHICTLLFLLFALTTYAQTPLHSAIEKMGNGNYKGALSDCNNAIAQNPNLGESYQVRGTVKVALGDYKGAILDCNKAIGLKPSSKFLAAAYLWRGVAKLQLGDRSGGCKDMRTGGDMGNMLAYDFIGQYCD